MCETLCAPTATKLPEAEQYNSQSILEKIGIDPVAQSERAKSLIKVLGDEGVRIARKENDDNKRMYFREFILDEPVSESHEYFLHNGHLYSDGFIHNLTRIDKGISPGEREGRTLKGFHAFENLLSNPENKAVIWYSHAGPGGKQPPFSNLYYESGRLYVSLKGAGNISRNLDIKIQEKTFPVKQLLEHLSGESHNLEDYLTLPFALKNNNTEFIEKLLSFNKAPVMENDPEAYIARRHDSDRRVFRWADIVEEIKNQMLQTPFSLQPLWPKHTSEGFMEQIIKPEQIAKGFYDQIFLHMQATGKKEVVLYGCSSTSRVGGGGFDISIRGIIQKLLGEAAPSVFQNQVKSAAATGSQDKKDYSFDHEGKCVVCGNDPARLGPCNICEPCDNKLRAREENGLVF